MPTIRPSRRTLARLALLAPVLALAACVSGRDLDQPPAPLGDFALGHNVVVAPNIVKGPVSRDATPEEWIAAVSTAVEDRFGRYEGTRLYHLGISVEGYVLAQPGVPLVLSPKSALILKVTVWDDARGVKLNEEPEQITAMEAMSGKTFLGSGLTQSREEQMENLAVVAAKEIERWLVRTNRTEKWFENAPEAPEAAAPAEDAEDTEGGTEEDAEAAAATDEGASSAAAELPPETAATGG